MEWSLEIILRLALIGCLALSCSRLQNDADRLQLVCGPDVDPSQHLYVQIAEGPSTGFDAVLLSDGQWTALARSAYGCLEIPRSVKGSVELAIRHQSSPEGRVLRLDPAMETALIATNLTSDARLRDRQLRMLCPSNPYVTQKRLPLTRVEQPTRLLTRTVVRAELYNSKGERLERIDLTDDADSLSLGSNWAEGEYQLKLFSQDIFERNAPAFESSCQVMLDRTPPMIRSSLALEPFYEEARNIRRLSPGAQVTLAAEDASAAETYACLKPFPAVCADDDFLLLRSITAPTEGLWDLKAYATDKAGQRSPLLHETFAVYHQEQVDQLLARLSNVQLNLLLGLQAPALEAMLDAKNIREKLQLEGERTAIQWSYVENFWKLDQQLNLIRTIDFGQAIRQLSLSQVSDHFLLQGDQGQALLFENDRPVAELDRSLRSDFSRQDKLWTLANGGILRVYENKALLRSWQTDVPTASLASGASGDKVVIWSDKGQETFLSVYDRNAATDDPVFKTKLPKTPILPGKFSFFADDRYLIGRNNRQLLMWDAQQDYSLRRYDAPEGCIARDYAVRFDQKIYLVSHKARIPGQAGGPASETFCDLQLIDPANPGLTTTLAPRLSNVINPATLTLSAENQQNYLALSGTVSSFLHFLNLNNEEAGLNLKLNEFESIYRVAPMSEDKPIFFVSSSQRLRLLQFTYDNNPTEYFSGTRLGICTAQTRQQRFLCYDQDQSLLRIHSSERDRTLQPSVYRSFTSFRPDDRTQYVIAALLDKPLHAFFDRETLQVSLVDEDRTVRIKAQMRSDANALSLQESGRLALGLKDGSVAVLEEGSGLTSSPADEEAQSIIDVRMASDTVYALRRKADESFALETWRYEVGRLRVMNTLPLPKGPVYSAILFSEKTGRGAVYQKDDAAVTQEAVLFNQDGSENGRVPMSICSLKESRNSTGFHFVRDQSIFFHDFASGSEQRIGEALGYKPCAFLEGDQLFALSEYGSRLYEVKSGRMLAQGTNFAVGPQNTLVIVNNDNLKVMSADGRTTHVNLNFRIPTNINTLLASSDHPDIVLTYTEDPLGQGIRRLTTKLDSIDRRLKLWDR